MRILAMSHGLWGRRIADNVKGRMPQGWALETYTPPAALPPIVDDPMEFLPPELPQAELLLAMVENPTIAQLVPGVARLSGAKAVLCPIDNSAWVPPGLKQQLQDELTGAGIPSSWPKPFCSLTEETGGYRRAAERYSSPLISEFARHFGRPKLDLTVADGVVQKVEVVRGAPCGSTHYMSTRLEGTPVEEAVPKGGLMSHQYPCLASMTKEQIDDRLFDTLMHVSGFLVNEELEEKLAPYKKPTQYMRQG